MPLYHRAQVLKVSYLIGADFSGADLSKTVLVGADLSRVNLSKANLTEADLTGADLSGASLIEANLNKANLWAANLMRADLRRAKLTGANLWKANLNYADLTKANLRKADIHEAFLFNVQLRGADLSESTLWESIFNGANFTDAKLIRAKLGQAKLLYANFMRANLSGADLGGADLTNANLTSADLRNANLINSNLVGTRIDKANISKGRVYGINVWDLDGEFKEQKDLIITPDGESVITVDDIETAQFVYLLLNNQKIRNVIDTITTKAVLILGRFTEERKQVLDALREALRERGFVPILFDFQPSLNRDLTETIQLLANMAKFVIADLTEAKSIPQELSHIIPFLPSVPVQPILLESEREYAMFEHWRRFNTVLPELLYRDTQDLIDNLDTKVILPVNNWDKNPNEVERLKKELRELKAEVRQYKGS